MRRLLSLLYLLLAVATPSWVAAQTLTLKDIDARIENQLFEVVKLGTDVYNRGGQDACFRLYQGSLMSVMGFLDHRPDQVAKIQKVLKDTDNMTSVKERAFALREAIDELRAAIKATHGPVTTDKTKPPEATPPDNPAVPARKPLWDRLGGELSMTLITEDLVNRALANPRINLTRKGTGNAWEPNPENVSKLKKQLLHMLSAATGGPLKYIGKNMKDAHSKMKISDAEFDALMADLHSTLEKFFVDPKERDELIRIVSATKKDIVDPALMTKSLWSRLGGEPVVSLLADDFINRALKNPAVNFTRKGAGKDWLATPTDVTFIKRRFVQYLSSVCDGPQPYDGKTMKVVHDGMKITEAEFNALAADFKASLELMKVNVREQEELLKIINGTKSDIVEKK